MFENLTESLRSAYVSPERLRKAETAPKKVPEKTRGAEKRNQETSRHS